MDVIECPEDSGAWTAFAASVKGLSHEKIDKPCQDASGTVVLGDTFFAAIADGAGSAMKSEIGSTLAVSVALAELQGRVKDGITPDTAEPILKGAAESALAAIVERAAELELSPKDLATTLTLVAIRNPHVATFQVGDGLAVAKRQDGQYVALSTPQKGEYANETTFLTSSGAIDGAGFTFHDGPFIFAAGLTDGLYNVCTNEDGTPFEPFFDHLEEFCKLAEPATGGQAIADYLQSERIRARADDDLTLVVASAEGPRT